MSCSGISTCRDLLLDEVYRDPVQAKAHVNGWGSKTRVNPFLSSFEMLEWGGGVKKGVCTLDHQ